MAGFLSLRWIIHLPGWSSDVTAAFVVDANEGTFGTVAVGAMSELGIIGTLENILLIPRREKNQLICCTIKIMI